MVLLFKEVIGSLPPASGRRAVECVLEVPTCVPFLFLHFRGFARQNNSILELIGCKQVDKRTLTPVPRKRGYHGSVYRFTSHDQIMLHWSKEEKDLFLNYHWTFTERNSFDNEAVVHFVTAKPEFPCHGLRCYVFRHDAPTPHWLYVTQVVRQGTNYCAVPEITQLVLSFLPPPE